VVGIEERRKQRHTAQTTAKTTTKAKTNAGVPSTARLSAASVEMTPPVTGDVRSTVLGAIVVGAAAVGRDV
jgi:hypothetical protein